MTLTLNTHCLLPITANTSDLEREVMGWFAAGHEVLWIPIYGVGDGPSGMAEARAEAAHFGGPRLIHDVTDFYRLPLGIKGWLFPAYLDNTDVICVHEAPGEMSFGHLTHPITGQCLTWRYPTEAPVRRQVLGYRRERGL